MLKQSYPNLDAIPENLRGAYVADTSGEYVLDKLDAEHPVLKQNATLAKENTTYRGLNTKLTNEKAELEAKTLPEGHIAVPKQEYTQLKTEAETLRAENEGFKALGNLDEIKPKLEGYEGLQKQVKQSIRDKALLAVGVTDLDRARRFKSYDDLEIEIEVKDGKEIFHRVTKDETGKEVKAVFDGELLKSDGFKDDLGSLVGSGGTRMFRQSSDTRSVDTPAALAADHMKNRYKGIPAKAN